MTSALPQLQSAFGWIYFFAWSATFWPQVLLILRRRTTAGLSTDFVTINIVGFISYAIFTFSSYAVPAVSSSYVAATGYPPQVELADVLFAAHGAVMCSVLVAQLFLFPPRIAPRRYVAASALVAQALVLLGLALALRGRLDWYRYLSGAGAVKVVASLVKHFPQVWLNRERGSTVGWSFTMVLLDVVGGSFSVAQQAVKAVRMGSWAPFTANLAKTFLAAESLVFDFWFILQHTVFYADHTDIDLAPFKPVAEDEHAADAADEHVELVSRRGNWV
ncbi:unnamed protein product [Chondrus crispus]|uniref:Cystinosin n=1 Tax=Chondrus crispus TaxID=2769 RepID=R7QRV6_CHOCR|nr:unnamed protein product [Chondrus crispus]CDF40090.1 unnamed protein product [Chondrus crispus]|eukprot:XP_005710384.1 unnamed protein product [Chondrus crispus]